MHTTHESPSERTVATSRLAYDDTTLLVLMSHPCHSLGLRIQQRTPCLGEGGGERRTGLSWADYLS